MEISPLIMNILIFVLSVIIVCILVSFISFIINLIFMFTYVFAPFIVFTALFGAFGIYFFGAVGLLSGILLGIVVAGLVYKKYAKMIHLYD